MNEPPHPVFVRWSLFFAALVLIVAVFGCSIYANLSFAITDKTDLHYIPPFKPRQDVNDNKHLGGEYFQIGRSLAAGQGFAHPFDKPTGPTAWQAPVYPLLLAGLLRMCDDDRVVVMTVVIYFQVFVLIGTGLLVVALVRKTCSPLWTAVSVVVFLLALVGNFNLWFQFTHDCWLVLLLLDLLIAGLCWLRPMHKWQRAVGWGLFGGLCALTTPITGITWCFLSLLTGVHQRSWSRLGIALLVAGITVIPWTVRNYLVFGRLIPTKSNLAYELYQSQCLQSRGLLLGKTFNHHPYHSGKEQQEYRSLGESAYLERKSQQFWRAVWTNPQDYGERVLDRFLGATLWYESFWPGEAKRPWVVWMNRLTHPLPFLALLVLAVTSFWKPLHWAQGTVLAVYIIYLLPYIGASYYERYGLPLLGVKVLLVIWAAARLLSFWPRRPMTGAQPLCVSRSRFAPVHVSA